MRLSKNYRSVIVFLISMSPILPSLSIAETTIKFTEAKKFSDYQISGYSRTRSLKVLNVEFTNLFTEVSESVLVDGQTIDVDVTNIDLPGIIRFAQGRNHRDIRVVDSNTPFKLYFSYVIKNKDGEIVKQGEYKLKEFLTSHAMSRKKWNNSSTGYYNAPLEKWLKGLMKS